MVAIACTGALLATGIYGVTQLEIDYNPDEYFDVEEGSYQEKFLEAEKLFKEQEPGFLFLGNFNYSSQMDKIIMGPGVTRKDQLGWLSGLPT